MTNDDVVIWYTPRVRCWADKKGEFHLAGEPDGLNRILDAFRIVARRVEDEVSVKLRTDSIPKDRNPVSDRGVRQLFDSLTFAFVSHLTVVSLDVRGGDVVLSFSEKLKQLVGYSIVETVEGEGDFSIHVELNGAPARLWFWGYSNPHGVNTF